MTCLQAGKVMLGNDALSACVTTLLVMDAHGRTLSYALLDMEHRTHADAPYSESCYSLLNDFTGFTRDTFSE